MGGPPGSGKTTIAKMLAERLSLRHISIGMLFRDIAIKRGISLLELSRLAQQDPSIDYELDSLAKREAEKGGVVIDGHAAPWLLKELAHLRIAVTASIDTRLRRLAERDRKSIDEVLHETLSREQMERERFMRIYGIDISNYADFDLVINSERFSPSEIVKIVLRAVEIVIERS
ncbi:MAG: AAA family ATPase [Ignisphaera sp.]|nr:AAA family ATPase [Ignisphaera sp.]MCX8168506.1 AAA family ATPase [Ignisphaera sp.]